MLDLCDIVAKLQEKKKGFLLKGAFARIHVFLYTFNAVW